MAIAWSEYSHVTVSRGGAAGGEDGEGDGAGEPAADESAVEVSSEGGALAVGGGGRSVGGVALPIETHGPTWLAPSRLRRKAKECLRRGEAMRARWAPTIDESSCAYCCVPCNRRSPPSERSVTSEA